MGGDSGSTWKDGKDPGGGKGGPKAEWKESRAVGGRGRTGLFPAMSGKSHNLSVLIAVTVKSLE